MRKIVFTAICLASLIFTGCDDHIELPNPLRPGLIYCQSGEFKTLDELNASTEIPIAVVFYVNSESEEGNLGFAVALQETGQAQFAEEDGSVDTSCSLTAMDGFTNTNKMRTGKVSCPVADLAAGLLQGAFVPSYAQMVELSNALTTVNPILEAIGGTPVCMDPQEITWYWTSTEVPEASFDRAYMFSLANSQARECAKSVALSTRPIIRVARYNK